jgi:hypothetical protein
LSSPSRVIRQCPGRVVIVKCRPCGQGEFDISTRARDDRD